MFKPTKISYKHHRTIEFKITKLYLNHLTTLRQVSTVLSQYCPMGSGPRRGPPPHLHPPRVAQFTKHLHKQTLTDRCRMIPIIRYAPTKGPSTRSKQLQSDERTRWRRRDQGTDSQPQEEGNTATKGPSHCWLIGVECRIILLSILMLFYRYFKLN